jgi:hypothetical protein
LRVPQTSYGRTALHQRGGALLTIGTVPIDVVGRLADLDAYLRATTRNFGGFVSAL